MVFKEQQMNLAVYTQTLGLNGEVEAIINSLNEGVETSKLSAGSIFFNSVGFNPLPMKCGCFNAADLWNFTGTLLVTTLANFIRASSIVNKAKIVYYHGWEEGVPILHLINISKSKTAKVICRTKEDEREFYRITGKKASGVVDDFNLEQLVKLV